MPIDSGNQWSLMRKTKKKEKVGHVNNAQLLSLLTLSPNQAIISWNFGTWFRLPPIPIYIHSVFQCKRTIIKFKKKKGKPEYLLKIFAGQIGHGEKLGGITPRNAAIAIWKHKVHGEIFSEDQKIFFKKKSLKDELCCAVPESA